MDDVWLMSALWVGLALAASVISLRASRCSWRVLLADDRVDAEVIDEGNIHVQPFPQHLADQPIFHTPSKAGAVPEFDPHIAHPQGARLANDWAAHQ